MNLADARDGREGTQAQHGSEAHLARLADKNVRKIGICPYEGGYEPPRH